MSAGSLGSASGEIQINVQQALANLDALAAKLNGTETAGSGIGKGVEQGGSRLDAFGGKVDSLSRKYGELGKIGMAYGAIVGAGFGIAINSAANFEQAMSYVGAALGGVGVEGGVTAEQFSALNDEALRIGATTSASAGEAATAMELLGKAGIGADQILNGAAQAVVNVSEATGESINQSASSFGSLMNLFADTGISSSEMADTIVNGMNASDASLAEFQTGIARLAPTIAATGMSFQDSAAAVAYFNSQGFAAATVGTSLDSAFQSLANPTAAASEAMQELGINAFDAQGKFIGFPALFDQVRDATAGMTDQQKAATLSTIFGASAMDVMTLAAKNGGDGLREYEALMGTTGSAATASAQRMDNMKGAIEQLRGAMESAMIVIGSGFTPIIRKIAETLARMVEGFLALPRPIQKALTAIVGISGAMAGLAGAMVVMGPKAILIAKQMSGMVGAITKMVPALLGLSAPILLIVAALALLAVAYKTNLFGFRDAVNNIASSAVAKFKTIADGVRTFAKLVKFSFDMFRGQGQNPVEASLNAMSRGFDYAARRVPALAGAFTKLSAASKSLGKFAGAVGDEFTKAEKIFGNFRRIGLNPVAAGFKTAQAVMKDVSHAFGPLAPLVSRAADALGFAGEFAQKLGINFAGLRGSTNIVSAAIQAVGVTLGQMAGHFGPFEGAVTSIGRAFMNMGAAFNQGFKGVKDLLAGNYAGAIEHFKNAWDAVKGMFTNLGSAAKSAFGAIKDAISNVDWGGLLSGVGSALSGLWDRIKAAFQSVDWGAVGDFIVGAAESLASKAREMISGFVDALVAEFPRVISWIGSIGQFIGAAVVSGAEWLAPRAAEAISGLVDRFVAEFPRVLSWIGSIGQFIGAAVVSGAEWLAPRAVEAISGFLDKLVAEFPRVLSWLGSIGQFVGAAVVDAAQWLAPRAVELVSGFLDKLVAEFPRVLSWMGSLGTFLAAAVPSLASTIVSKASELLQGFLNGLNDKWPTISSWLGLAGSLALAAIGDLGAILYDKGVSLLQGLWDGMQAKWEEIKGWRPWDGWLGGDEGKGNSRIVRNREAPDTSGAQDRNSSAMLQAPTTIPAPDFSAVTAALTALKAMVTASFADIISTATTATSSMAAQVGSRFAAMSAQSGVAINQMRSLVGAAMLGMSAQVNAAINQMAAQVASRMQVMGSQATSSANQMRASVGAAMSGMASQGASAANQFASAVQSGFSRAVAAAHSGVAQIRGAVAGLNLYGQGYSIGNSLGSGIAAGISGMIGSVASAAASLVTSAVNAANAAAKINSPSKLTMMTGQSLAEGLEVGIGKGARDVLSAMADLIPSANGALAMQSLPVTGRSTVITNVVNVYPLRSDEYQQLISNAQVGGDFARSMGRSAMAGGLVRS